MADRRAAIAVLAALLLAGCAGEAEPVPEDETVSCALGGATEPGDECVVERVHHDGAEQLVIHHPDGAFRRLIVLPSGGLIAADGADQAEVTERDGALAVTLGQDRYLIPSELVASNAQ